MKVGTQHCDLYWLGGDLAGMACGTCPDLDQATLNAREGPIGHFFRQICTPEKVTKIVDQSIELEPDLFVTEALVGALLLVRPFVRHAASCTLGSLPTSERTQHLIARLAGSDEDGPELPFTGDAGCCSAAS